MRKVTTAELFASIVVALAAVNTDEEDFPLKFAAPVNETFTFVSDAKVQ
jgi:hypothetical protein